MATDTEISLESARVEAPGSFSVTVEFTGGLEMLFANERKHGVTLPAQLSDGGRPRISFLLEYLVENVMKDERKELFILEGNVRPGILVLINDADWELEGEENYELQPGDNIVFVSTLHGG
ncbi:Ubiquitin-related modifier 1 [Aspergillus pseudonomiae]|uniref:Ubiquitin-related modifier 1 n=1 Tax=Aspergillus nomiae NRRL (strain ATCC 15546 / NRRL 13137 / CBS 260.88 / M93) TaxID=1509407 RepID=A0A0L1J1X4_ASPN3|nr:ubiquitin-related modifier 1 [Aspergillus nomiae NRRL 13137]KNG85811.1 ubiquitin-related modifier 1 [Aspergillus nomiae NRRL 13137]